MSINGNFTNGTGAVISGTGTIQTSGTYNGDGIVFGQTTNAITSGTTITGGALPVEFMGLTYKINPDNVELEWETASEIFNDYFTIEKSKDGTNFEIIETIQGAGYSNSIVKYNFYDKNVTDGICYYRIKQTDYDGTTVILKTIACKIAPDKNTLITFQNPIVDQTFQINYSGESGKYVLNIYNTNGQIILSKENISDNNSGTFDINRSGLKGYYFISIMDPFGKISSYPVVLN